MFPNFSPWKANTSVLVGIVVFTLGLLVFGGDEGELESSLVLWGSFASAFATHFLLHYREDRAHDRAVRKRSEAPRG